MTRVYGPLYPMPPMPMQEIDGIVQGIIQQAQFVQRVSLLSSAIGAVDVVHLS